MSRLKWLIQNFEEVVCFALTTIMTILIGAQVLLRLLGAPLSWTEEIARYMFVATVYIGAALAVKRRKSLKVDAVLLLFKPRGRFILEMISNTIFAIWAGIMGYFSFQQFYDMLTLHPQKSPAVQLPMAIPYSMVWFGLLLCVLRLIQDMINLCKERKLALAQENSVSDKGGNA